MQQQQQQQHQRGTVRTLSPFTAFASAKITTDSIPSEPPANIAAIAHGMAIRVWSIHNLFLFFRFSKYFAGSFTCASASSSFSSSLGSLGKTDSWKIVSTCTVDTDNGLVS
jgi:hypothetical protein